MGPSPQDDDPTDTRTAVLTRLPLALVDAQLGTKSPCFTAKVRKSVESRSAGFYGAREDIVDGRMEPCDAGSAQRSRLNCGANARGMESFIGINVAKPCHPCLVEKQ